MTEREKKEYRLPASYLSRNFLAYYDKILTGNTIYIPGHTHKDSNKLFQKKSRAIWVDEKPFSLDCFSNVFLIFVSLVPIAGLVRAYQIKKSLDRATVQIGYSPSFSCEQKECVEAFVSGYGLICISILGGLGILVPILILVVLSLLLLGILMLFSLSTYESIKNYISKHICWKSNAT
ncbi:hypothetical protein X556_0751 [Chlamydia pneumoniae B21]|nr:hypothetical protein X556_0751 [Chlamydia pneumoniae B21]